jgi:hypothetical protein
MRLLISVVLMAFTQISMASDKLELPYWPCKLDSSTEFDHQWGQRIVNVHKLCFFNSADNEIDTAEMMMLSVLDHESKAKGRPVFFRMIEGINSKIETVTIDSEKLLILSYLSGANSHSTDVFKLDDYLVLTLVGSVLSDEGVVMFSKSKQGLFFQSVEQDENGNGAPVSYKYNGETLIKVKR